MTDKEPMTDKKPWWRDPNFPTPPPPKEAVLRDKTYRNPSLTALVLLAWGLIFAGVVLLIFAFNTHSTSSYYDTVDSTGRALVLAAIGAFFLLIGSISLVARLILTSLFIEQAAGNKWAVAWNAANAKRANAGNTHWTSSGNRTLGGENE